MLVAGRPMRLATASAISRNGMPSSPTACQVVRMYGRPTVRASSGIGDEAFLLRERRKSDDKARTIGRAVRYEGDPHDRRPHTLLGKAEHGGLHDIARHQSAFVQGAAR